MANEVLGGKKNDRRVQCVSALLLTLKVNKRPESRFDVTHPSLRELLIHSWGNGNKRQTNLQANTSHIQHCLKVP